MPINDPGVGMRSLAETVRDPILANRRGAVVRRGRRAIGSGFLVGPDLLLTAEHVVRSGTGPLRHDVEDLDVVFDFYDQGRIEAETGEEVGVRKIPRWSPVHDEELAGVLLSKWDVPATHLDYALLRLDRRAGEEPTEDTGVRGWYRLDEKRIDVARAGLVTLYHFPLGKWIVPSFIRTGVRLNPAGTETRMRYETNSLPGSSGGFLIDESGLLIGLHNYGTPSENQAIPIWRIAEDLKDFLAAENLPAPPAPIIDLGSIGRSGVALRPAQVDEMMESISSLLERWPAALDGITLDARHELRTGRGERYVRLLEDAARRGDRPLETREVRACYERQVWLAEPIGLLQKVRQRDLLQAYRFAVGFEDRDAPPDATSAVLRAAIRGMRGDPSSPLYRLLARLSFTAGTETDLWLSKELSPTVAAELFEKVKPVGDPPGQTSLVFDLRGISSGDEPTFKLPVHQWCTIPGRDGGWLEPKPATVCGRTAEAVRVVVETEIQELMKSTDPQRPLKTSVEFVLSRTDLGLLSEMGNIDPFGKGILTAPLAHFFPVLIHLAERFIDYSFVPPWYARLRRIDDFRDAPLEVEWLPQGATVRGIDEMTASCAAFDFVPASAEGLDDPFYSALFEGAPFILWSDDEPAKRKKVKSIVNTLVNESELDTIPERLHKARGQLKKYGTSIRLIWDDDARLPPGLIPKAVEK